MISVQLYGGAPLSKVVGDALVSKGVRLRQALGSYVEALICKVTPCPDSM